MKTYTNAELKEILKKHWKWLRGEKGGQRADLQCAYLQCADLQGAYLQGAYLQGADLRGAYLQGADLRGADLQCADLQGAYLQGADLRETILSGVNWLAYIGIVPDANGKARAYKMTNCEGEGPYNGGINYAEKDSFEVDDIDTDRFNLCGRGINLATLQWCLSEKSGSDYRLFLMEFDVSSDNICVPVATDGKFRVKSCIKIGECDWNGNLLPAQPEGRGGH